MGRFKNVNKDYDTLLMYLVTNQELCKLLYYKNPIINNKPINPFIKPDVIAPYKTLYKSKIFKTHKIPTADEGGCFLIVKLDDFRPWTNKVFRANTIVCDVYVHQDDEEITQGLRVFEILDRLDDMLGSSTDFGLGKLKFAGSSEVNEKDNYPFIHYKIAYMNTDFSR